MTTPQTQVTSDERALTAAANALQAAAVLANTMHGVKGVPAAVVKELATQEAALVAARNRAQTAATAAGAWLTANPVVTPPPANPITITTTSLPAATVGVAYDGQLRATSTAGTVSWKVTSTPALPTGLEWSGNLDIVGTPSVSGAFTIAGTLTDGTNSVPVSFPLTVNAAPVVPPVTPPVTPPPSTGKFNTKIGIFVGNNGDPTSQAQELGIAKFPFLMSFVPGSNLGTISGNAAADAAWATQYGARLIFPFNGLPDTGVTADQAANGAMNATAVAVAQDLIANGQANAIIRIGWEENGQWFPWGVNHETVQQWLAIWHQLVASMRSVSGQQFLFYFNPTLDLSTDVTPWLPPSSEVDIIGLDVYDQTASAWPGDQAAWNSYLNAATGLNWLTTKAAELGKQIGFGEWGLGYNAGANGGDDAYFVTQFAAWCEANPVLFAAVWCDPAANRLPDPSNPLASAALKAACA